MTSEEIRAQSAEVGATIAIVIAQVNTKVTRAALTAGMTRKAARNTVRNCVRQRRPLASTIPKTSQSHTTASTITEAVFAPSISHAPPSASPHSQRTPQGHIQMSKVEANEATCMGAIALRQPHVNNADITACQKRNPRIAISPARHKLNRSAETRFRITSGKI